MKPWGLALYIAVFLPASQAGSARAFIDVFAQGRGPDIDRISDQGGTAESILTDAPAYKQTPSLTQALLKTHGVI